MQGIEHLILTSADLEHAFGRQFIRPDKLRLYAGRREVDLELMKVKHNDRIDLQRLAQLFAQGVTAVVNRVDRSFPAISDMVNTLTMWLRESIEVVAVMSFGEQSGISAHHDHENVFIVQLEGGKEWTLLGNPVPLGWCGNGPCEAAETERKLTLAAGDVMFLPVGQRHFCRALGQSLHLGICIRHTTARDILEDFGLQMAKDPELNVPLLGFLGAEHEQARIEAFKARMHQLVDELDLSGDLAALRQRRRLVSDFTFPSSPAAEKS